MESLAAEAEMASKADMPEDDKCWGKGIGSNWE
jgi:hypothetical protein